MIIVDRALQARAKAKNPIKVAMIGAGFMGRGIANQIVNSVPGMELVAIANRHLAGAERAYSEAGIAEVQTVKTTSGLKKRSPEANMSLLKMLRCCAKQRESMP